MPAKSQRQQRFMGMCAHSPGKANKKCPPQKVAEEFAHKPPGGYQPLKGKRKKRIVPRPDRHGFY